MNDLERIWSEKSDDALLEAAASLNEFTEEGRRVVLAELERRGLEVPGSDDEDAGAESLEGEDVSDDPLSCLRCGVKLQHLGRRDLASLGEFGRLFEGKELLEVYSCPRCGHVDLFTDVVEAEEGEEEQEDEGGRL
jgi:hypothetical protein